MNRRFFFFKQKTSYDSSACLVGSKMCIEDKFQGYPEASALELAARFGPDMKRAYRAEYGRDPLTYVAVFPGATNNVCIYDRIHDAELLGSCWRMFQRGRS